MRNSIELAGNLARRLPNGGSVFGPSQRSPTRRLVLFLHGSRGNGSQVEPVVEALAGKLHDTVFYAPNGLEAGDPGKFQHFEIVKHYKAAQFGKPPQEWGQDEAARMRLIEAGIRRATRPYNVMLDRLQITHGIDDAHTAIIGFSQGGQMALHMATRRNGKVAAVVSLSGTLLEPDALVRDLVSRPPVLLTHGAEDNVLPPRGMQLAHDALTEAGCEVETRLIPHCGHHEEWVRGLPDVAAYLPARLAPHRDMVCALPTNLKVCKLT